MLMEHTTLEMTTTNRLGLLSQISAVLAELRCHVSLAVAWTHNTRVACIIHVEDDSNHGSILDPQRVDHVQAQLETVVNAHHTNSGRPNFRLTSPATGQTHAERRLHQLMMADKDYEGSTYDPGHNPYDIVVTVEDCQEEGYLILNITSPNRPKLLFDTVCTLTDLRYVVFHATVSSKGSVAHQVLYRFCCSLKSYQKRFIVPSASATPEPVNVPTASSNSVHKPVLLGEVVVKARTIPKE
ncbi:ACT domain-containing protein ACR1 [Tanacetum coccineum]